jgi:GTP cyclohydrolase II
MSLENGSSHPFGSGRALAPPVQREPTPPRVRNRVKVPLHIGHERFSVSEIITFEGLDDGREHLMVVFGDALSQPVPMVRLHSECLTGDVLGSARCDCGPQLREAITLMGESGGLLLYLRQEGRDIGLYNKIDAYALQDAGMDTFEANRALNFQDDQRTYSSAAQMLAALEVTEIEILSNNPDKISQLQECGVIVHSQRRTAVHVNDANRKYLKAKAAYAGHSIIID